MGSSVDKEKFVDQKGQMNHYFKVPGYPLCGGLAPAFNSAIRQLHEDKVGLIVTGLLEPLRGGRLINHLPDDFSDTEWTEADPDLEKTIKDLNIEILHIPIQDGCPPVNKSVEKLLSGVKDFLQRRPNEKIYVHCWRGSGRTSLLLAIILHSIYQLPIDEAYTILSQSNPRFRLTNEYQQPYLKLDKNPDFPNLSPFLYKEMFQPVMRTPADHECWKKGEGGFPP